MKPQTSFINLTERPPRSLRVRLGNYVILARMLDKGRATLARKNGEYKYNSGTDQHLVRFLGLDAKALLKELAKGKSDGEILEWVQAHSKAPRAPWEIEAWSAFMEKRGPDSDAETLERLGKEIGLEIRQCEPEYFQGKPLSSSLIREAIFGGRLDEAKFLLGRPPSVIGTVGSAMRP